jgi:hypothetical protein
MTTSPPASSTTPILKGRPARNPRMELMSVIWPLSSGDRRTAFLLAVINFSIPAFVLLQRPSRDMSDGKFILVGWISAIFLNSVILFGLNRRIAQTGKRISSAVVSIAVIFAMLSGVITTAAVAMFPQPSYLQLAQSSTPLSQIEPEQKRLMVELIRHTAANSAENTRLATSMKPISPPLYSVSSFASKGTMESTSSQLKQAYDIDLAYNAARHQTMRDFHDKMLQVDPSYLHQFESSMHNEEEGEAAIASAEDKWIASAQDLYAYAEAHADKISVTDGGKLQIVDQDIRKSLEEQIEASEALQKEMLDDRQKIVDKHHDLQIRSEPILRNNK